MAFSRTKVFNKMQILNQRVRHFSRKYQINENYLDQGINSNEKAWWWGWLMSDGNIVVNNVNYSVRWELKFDAFSVLFQLRECIDSTHLVKFHTRSKRGEAFKKETYNYTTLQLWSKNLAIKAEELLGTRCGEKTFKLKYPSMHSDYNAAFIRGIFEGDGSLGFDIQSGTVRFEIASANYQFLCDIQTAINRHCLTKSEKRGSIIIRKNINVLHYCTWKDILHICNWMYDKKSSMFYDRKYNRFQKCKEMFGDGSKGRMNRSDRTYHIQQYKQTEEKLSLEILQKLKQWKHDPLKQKELNIKFHDNFQV